MFGYANNTPAHIIAEITATRTARDEALRVYTDLCANIRYSDVTAENTDPWYASLWADYRTADDLNPAETAAVAALKADLDASEAEYARVAAIHAQWAVPYGENEL